MSTVIPACAVVFLKASPAWLSKPRDERRKSAAAIAEIQSRHPNVAVTWFDSDALAGTYTDFAICRFHSLAEYHFLWEELKDSQVFTQGWFEITNVAIGLERGYQAYEQNSQH